MRSKRFILIAVVIILVAAFAGGILIYYQNQFASAPLWQNPIIQQPTSSFFTSSPTAPVTIPQNNTYAIDDFYLMIRGRIARSSEGYRIEPDFYPLIPSVFSDSVPAMEKIGKSNAAEEGSIYRVQTIDGYGRKTEYRTAVGYILPGNDVMRFVSEDLPVGGEGYLDDVFIHVTPQVKQIDYFVGNTLVKTIQRMETPPKIVSFGKEAGTQVVNSKEQKGYFIAWNVGKDENQLVSVFVQLKSASVPSGWSSIMIGSPSDTNAQTRIFQNPEEIQSSEEYADYRIGATDGFRVHVWVQEDLIPVVHNKNVELFLHTDFNRSEGWVVGQNANIDLSFFDPETGEGCDAQGCKNGSYDVRWSSNLQKMCPYSAYHSVDYFFEVPGTHIVTITVQNKQRPSVRGESSLKTVATQGLFPPPNNQPTCEE